MEYNNILDHPRMKKDKIISQRKKALSTQSVPHEFRTIKTFNLSRYPTANIECL